MYIYKYNYYSTDSLYHSFDDSHIHVFIVMHTREHYTDNTSIHIVDLNVSITNTRSQYHVYILRSSIITSVTGSYIYIHINTYMFTS